MENSEKTTNIQNAIGIRVREARKRAKLTQEELGVMIGYTTKAGTSDIERGKTIPDSFAIKIIAEATKTEELWLLTGDGEMFKQPKEPALQETAGAVRVSGGVKVYHLGSAFAGDVISLDDNSLYDNVEEWLIPPLGITATRSTALVSFTINGDSMQPTLQRGDILICDAPTNRIEDISNNAIYVILVPGYPPRCKRLIVSRDRKSITIISDNPAYRDEFAADGAFSACRARHRLTDISEFI